MHTPYSLYYSICYSRWQVDDTKFCKIFEISFVFSFGTDRSVSTFCLTVSYSARSFSFLTFSTASSAFILSVVGSGTALRRLSSRAAASKRMISLSWSRINSLYLPATCIDRRSVSTSDRWRRASAQGRAPRSLPQWSLSRYGSCPVSR